MVYWQPTTESWHRGHRSLEASTMEREEISGKLEKMAKFVTHKCQGTELGGTSPGQNVEGIVKASLHEIFSPPPTLNAEVL